MALPIVKTPTYELKIPSTGKKIKYRPFLVKEEKILMMAAESKDPNEITEAVKKIVVACVESPKAEDTVNSFSLADFEYVFINLRCRSVGESVEVGIACSHCKADNKVKVDLSDIEVSKMEKGMEKVEITSKMGIVLKSPGLDDIGDLAGLDPMKVLIRCIDYIYDADQIYKAVESTEAELVEFVDSLSYKHLEAIKDFFDSMPRVRKEIAFTCKECGKEDSYKAEGMTDFFS